MPRTTHDVYDSLIPAARREVDYAFTLVQAHLKGCGVPCANDDRAERLVEAIATYLVVSGSTK